MPTTPRVLVIGATGLIGLPVTRQLVAAGFDVTALARDPVRARAKLPAACAVVEGDLRNVDSLVAPLRNADAVYLSLANAMTARRPRWDADADGTPAVLEAARQAGGPRVLRLSAMGIAETTVDWWVARVKRENDAALEQSGLPYTIFRPTWLMESIALPAVGPFLMRLPAPADPIYWLAGDDFGRQVAAAIARDDTVGRVYLHQGPQGVSMADAFRRFRRVWRNYLLPMSMPSFLLEAGARVQGPLHYLSALLRMTYEVNTKFPARVDGHDLHEPTVTIEQFATELLSSRQYPIKSTR